MKKILTALLILTLCLGFTGCSATDDKVTENKEAEDRTGENKVTHYKEGDVTLGEYKGLTYTPMETSISDEDFEDYLKYLCEQNPVLTDKGADAVVENGNVVAMDFEGIRDGVAFDGGTGSIEDLEIGSNRFIESLEQGLIGHTLGECEVECTFPETYMNTELAGVTVIFKCNIRSISEKKVFEFNDEFAQISSLGEYQTAEEYRVFLREAVNGYQKDQADSNKLMEIQNALIESCTINKDITEDVNVSVENLTNYYNEIYRNAYGCNASVYFRENYYYTDAMFEQLLRNEAEVQVKYSLIKAAIADAENIEVTDEEVKAFITECTEKAEYETEEEYKAAVEEGQEFTAEEYSRQQLRLNKAEEIVLNAAVPKEAEESTEK